MSANPVLDPVTVKEIFGISRRGQTYVGRVIYVGLIGLILYQFWSYNIARQPFLSPSAYAALGRDLFRQFVPMQMFMVGLASIGAAADRIIREERAGTLGLLLLTPLSARRIAFAKWKAAMAQAGSLILCGLPVVAVCVYLGSVGPWDLLWCFAVTLSMAMLGAAFALRASAIYATVPRALVMAFLYLIGYTLLPLILIFVAGVGAIFAAPFLNPVYSVYWLVIEKTTASDSIWVYAWIPATLVSFIASWYIVGRVGPLIERRVKVPKLPTLPIVDPEMPAAVLPTPKKLSDRPVVRLTREVWERDPLLWKEFLTRGGSRWSAEVKSMFLVYSLIFISLFWLFSQAGHSLGCFAFLGVLFCFLALVNGASLFAPEKEGRKMEMLLSSPVTSAGIVRSKLLAGMASPESVRVLLLALATAVGFSWWSGPGILVYVGVLMLFLVFVFMLSAAASLHANSLQGAALGTAGILCCLLLVVPIIVSVLTPPGRMDDSLPPVLLLMSSLNPVWILEPLSEGHLDLRESFGRFLLFAFLYGTASAGLGGLMLWRFDRIMGRT
jgi:ABC-type transport system involved in multi-copper enzyme maturation permease subunit